MIDNKKSDNIQKSLIKWYEANKRDLPWRNTSDPYIIWISEIILQQTRVDQGYDYFVRFVKQFPDIKALAKASEEEVLKLWQGLGYYSRARNLHHTAQYITDHYNGKFPDKYNDILSLKGIGDYTAAAIASFSYNMPYATVDGNVYRVLSRLYAIDTPINSTLGKKTFAALAQDILNVDAPATHNQAMMEMGALQCTPSNPDCSICPLSLYCLAYISGNPSAYPVKEKKVKIKERYFNYLDIRFNNTLFLNKRTDNDIWKNLYELPLIETERQIEPIELQDLPQFKAMFIDAGRIIIKAPTFTIKHVLSHRIIYASFYKITIENEAVLKNKYLSTNISNLSQYPISRLVDRYFEETLDNEGRS